MARNREKPGSMKFQVQKNLQEKLAIGQSKHKDKINGRTGEKIYSWQTYKTYTENATKFGNWAKNEHGCKTLEEARPYVDRYIESRKEQGISPYTQKLEACAIAKVYSCSTKDFTPTDTRHRADITRSRGEKVRDKHFSEYRNKEFVDFCRSTGLRRSEITSLKSSQLHWKGEKPYLHIRGKGGREREAPIIGSKEQIQAVVSKMEGVKGRVWEKVPSGADIHAYRAEYATNLYNSYARPIESIPYDRLNSGSGGMYQSEVYCCRGDLEGTKYDKIAMQKVSQALGHNRISVIAGHYIR